jgi:hypothetical protein
MAADEWLQQKLYGPGSLKCLLSGPLQMFVDSGKESHVALNPGTVSALTKSCSLPPYYVVLSQSSGVLSHSPKTFVPSRL